MKNFILSTNRNNLRLFISLTIVALFAVTSLLLWQTTAQTQTAKQFSINGVLLPTLGNYPNMTVTVGANTTITPDAVPTNTTSINVSTNSNFKGNFTANPTTGIIRVTNVHPAGTYTVTVKAFGSGGMTTRTFTLTVVSGTFCNAPVFTNVPNVNLDANSNGAVVGDFNNDGNQDFAVILANSSNIAIRLGDGAGNFSSTTNIGTISLPSSIGIGDFNNDGNQDFAAPIVALSSVSIRLGDGTGNFSGTTNISVTNFPGSIAVGDFNNDGNQDFATANGISNSVSIRLGDGTGNFSGTTNISVSTQTGRIMIGDFNNDGNQDFAVSNSNSNSVAIRLGDGTGNFSGTTSVSVGGSPSGITIGDFNNNGNQDFAAAIVSLNNVAIRLGDGAGNFSGTTSVGVGNMPSSVAIGDFNNDGNQDFATSNGNTNSVSVRLGDGTGNFNALTEVGVGLDLRSIAIGDFNNDGTQDFVVANGGAPNLSIRLGACGVPTPTPSPTPTPTPTPGPEFDFTITQTAAPNPVTVGQQLTYTLTPSIVAFSFPQASPQIRFNFPSGVPFVFNSANGTNGYTATADATGVTFSGGILSRFGMPTATLNIIITPQASGTLTSLGSNAIVDPNNLIFETNENNNTAQTITTTVTPSNVCTPSTTVTEGDLFPGGIVSFGVTSGAGSVTVDHVNAGTGLRSLTVVIATNAVVVIPSFTPGTTMPVVVTFTPINPGLAVDFTLRAASTFHAANIRARCAEVCTPSTTVTEGDLFPGGIVSFGISSGPGLVTVDHVNAGTGTQSLTVVGTPTNVVVNIPAFTIGTTMPIVVTFTPIDANQPVDFTLRAASTFHAANIRVRCGTLPPRPERK